MKKNIIILFLLAVGFIGFSAFTLTPSSTTIDEAGSVEWLDWETAVERNKTDKRPFMVDIYTNWCGYCKKMDRETFTNKEVADYINKNFHAVKLNAEMKKAINWNGHTFDWVEGGRNGVHTLAYALLDGKMGYPAFVYLNESMERIMISPGYKRADDVMKELTFAEGKYYQSMSWEDYKKK